MDFILAKPGVKPAKMYDDKISVGTAARPLLALISKRWRTCISFAGV